MSADPLAKASFEELRCAAECLLISHISNEFVPVPTVLRHVAETLEQLRSSLPELKFSTLSGASISELLQGLRAANLLTVDNEPHASRDWNFISVRRTSNSKSYIDTMCNAYTLVRLLMGVQHE